MAYIGKSPDGTGVRSRFYYTQSSGGGTSVSGSSDDGTTLAFSDGAYVDVFLNGVLLVAGTDYNTTTANTIAGLAALAAGDVVEVVVYDIFTVADTVSSLNGGTFSNSVTIDIDGGTALTVDRATSDGDIIELQKDGTKVGSLGSRGGGTSFITLKASSGSGSGLTGSDNRILPMDESALADNNTDLGMSSYRFKDMYLGGNLYIGGTAAANALDDYEEGTWTPTIVGSISASSVTTSYTKIGQMVFVTCQLVVATNTNSSSLMQISGLPYTASSDGAGTLAYTTASISNFVAIQLQTTSAYFYTSGGGILTPSTFSNKHLRFSGLYKAA